MRKELPEGRQFEMDTLGGLLKINILLLNVFIAPMRDTICLLGSPLTASECGIRISEINTKMQQNVKSNTN